MKKRETFKFILIATFAFFLLILSLNFASAVDINYCQTLNQANTVYKLTQDIAAGGTCFIIAADGITIDGNGHRLTGTGSGYGVDATNLAAGAAGRSLTLRNIIISGFSIDVASFGSNGENGADGQSGDINHDGASGGNGGNGGTITITNSLVEIINTNGGNGGDGGNAADDCATGGGGGNGGNGGTITITNSLVTTRFNSGGNGGSGGWGDGMCGSTSGWSGGGSGSKGADGRVIPSGSYVPPAPTSTCSDGIQNQGETGIDCGGICASSENKKCPIGTPCGISQDCASGLCTNGICVAPDNQAPIVIVISPAAETVYNTPQTIITINASVTDNVAVSSVISSVRLPDGSVQQQTLIQSGGGSTYSSLFTIPAVYGRYIVTFTATDNSNNINNAVTTAFNLVGCAAGTQLCNDNSCAADCTNHGGNSVNGCSNPVNAFQQDSCANGLICFSGLCQPASCPSGTTRCNDGTCQSNPLCPNNGGPFSQCSSARTSYTFLDPGNIGVSQSTMNGAACAGQDKVNGTTDDCCPSGWSCSTSNVNPGCKLYNVTDTTAKCSFYTDQGQSACQNDSRHLAPNDPSYSLYNCGTTNNTTNIYCSCSWDYPTNTCAFGKERRTLTEPITVLSKCVYGSTLGECSKGFQNVDITVLNSTGFDSTCKDSHENVPCLRSTIQLPFFGTMQFTLSAIAITLLYLFMFGVKAKK